MYSRQPTHKTPIKDDLSPHIDIVSRHATFGLTITEIPRLSFCIGQSSVSKTFCLYKSMVCFILQGSKCIFTNDELIRYGDHQYLVSALDLPFTGKIFDAGEQHPYISISIEININILSELVSKISYDEKNKIHSIGIEINSMQSSICNALLRFISLLDNPADIPVLGPIFEAEIIYYLLKTSKNKLLHSLSEPNGKINQIRKTASWIQDNYNSQLSIATLCDISGMSKASLHRHFLAITGLSPIQYQKKIRLQKARQLLLEGHHRASDVAFVVGYESASQFSREYRREFGAPPSYDINIILNKK